jgi:hypothetical protein
MKKVFKIYIASVFFIAANVNAQTGNYVFTGAEAVNFGVVDLATPGGQSWETDRSAAPGYFSATMGAVFTNTSDVANVNGYVKKYGNEAFTFPVGTGTDLRTLTISAPAVATDAYATAWILGDPSGNMDPTIPNAGNHSVTSLFPPLVSVSTQGQWDWQVGANLGTTGTGAGLTITVSIPDMTAFASASNLRLVGWNGTFWVDLSGGATASGNTENSTLSGTMIAGITAIAVGSTAWILPLQLESFTGVSSNCNTIINWKTSNETNADRFIIQKSTDSRNFTDESTVAASGNSSGKSYQVILAGSSAQAYYRLRMIEKDGTYNYSSFIAIHPSCEENENITVYPNPAKSVNTVYINFNTSYRGKANLRISNTRGQQVISAIVQVHSGVNKMPVNIDRFAAGTYFVTLITDKGQRIGTTQKFVK